MEFADMGDLLKIIKKRKITNNLFNEEEIWKIFTQIVSALSYLHKNKILHRDLKSSNILLSHGIVKMCDFGIAKILQHTDDLAKTCVGTP